MENFLAILQKMIRNERLFGAKTFYGGVNE